MELNAIILVTVYCNVTRYGKTEASIVDVRAFHGVSEAVAFMDTLEGGLTGELSEVTPAALLTEACEAIRAAKIAGIPTELPTGAALAASSFRSLADGFKRVVTASRARDQRTGDRGLGRMAEGEAARDWARRVGKIFADLA